MEVDIHYDSDMIAYDVDWFPCVTIPLFNSAPPSAEYMRQRTG